MNMINPWLNISISNTVADCDKAFLKGLPKRVLDKFEFRTLPEPFHGDPNANVYILHGNPLSGSSDLAFLGVPEYEQELVEEMSLKNREFLWLRGKETIKDERGIPYPAYNYWKTATKSLRMEDRKFSLFCVEAFPYHSQHANDFMGIKWLPSNLFTDTFIRDAISKNKYIVIMRCKAFWYERIKDLAEYEKTGRVLFLNTNRRPFISRNNLSASLSTQTQWEDFAQALLPFL